MPRVAPPPKAIGPALSLASNAKQELACIINFPLRRSDVTKSLQDWLTEGEQLYNTALAEYQSIESQLDELEARLAAKKAEVNQIAQVVGKPPVESSRR